MQTCARSIKIPMLTNSQPLKKGDELILKSNAEPKQLLPEREGPGECRLGMCMLGNEHRGSPGASTMILCLCESALPETSPPVTIHWTPLNA